VGELAAAVIALARVAFGVLVRAHAAGGLEHRLGGEVLAGDEFDARVLALRFVANGGRDLRSHLLQAPAHALLLAHACTPFFALSVAPPAAPAPAGSSRSSAIILLTRRS